ncbi:MAG: 4-(cytidine 5'-diphospho)-2-C-methyl-D-erythritol kinase [Desulfobacterales bacterium]
MEMTLLSPAKINLFLQVTGKRPDGYHDLVSLMCPVSLYDEISLTFERPTTTVTCSIPELPRDRRNLAYQAAERFFKAMDTAAGVDIVIEKRIPVAAGLGGGSSNAAAVLLGLNRHYDTPFSEAHLMKMGLSIGADVPFFIYGRPAIATGIGEQIEPYHGLTTPSPVVLVFPGFGVSTEMVYNNLTLGLTNCEETITCTCLKQQDFNAEDHLYNDLESVTVSKYPAILSVKEVLLRHGAKGALMSGSGPTVFGIFSEPGLAQNAAKIISENRKWQVFLAELLI